MSHDTFDCDCPNDSCLMSPIATTASSWSSCSIETLRNSFKQGLDHCLRDKPESLYGGPLCGNGFVEAGEECDCGSLEFCKTNCCDPTNCKLFNNATCATGKCCNLDTCQIKQASTLCRSVKNECDLPEYCTGKSEYCPDNGYKTDGEICKKGKAYCYQGFCATHDDQCKLLWGDSGKSSDEKCYALNQRGTRHGHCGYNRLSQAYLKCNDGDEFCGLVQCTHSSERLEFGDESLGILSRTFLNVKGSIKPCHTVLVDLGTNDVDVSFVPNGVKCSEEKMCVNQKCINVTEFKKTCPEDCNGHGVCNNRGHCHCDIGFAPPFCYSVHGGSIDSGPVSDYDNNFIMKWIFEAIYNCSSDRTFFDLNKEDLCNKVLS